MIFGVAKAISREHNAVGDVEAIVFDVSEVPHLGVTASLALENAIEEAIEKGCQVYIVGAAGQTRRRLEKLKVFDIVPPRNLFMDRAVALRAAAVEILPETEGPSSANLEPSSTM